MSAVGTIRRGLVVAILIRALFLATANAQVAASIEKDFLQGY